MRESWFPGRLHVLTESECLELLERTQVGRVAYCDEAFPVILPVNYVMDAGTVVFRTSPYSMLAQHLYRGHAAFQIDEIDEYTQSGWSVLVRGDATFVESADLPAADTRPAPWVEGARPFHVRITPDEITGRRLVPT
ncbi:MAG: pyridoxamine 5'-phosphate oxidase family protein [Nocardioides sp.]|uniref:pyridoxamine 5'-phosphate oxidase family protein n=1 Tax=Nocardioides sp. TaxID=35761 RepID=UPI0039E6C153